MSDLLRHRVAEVERENDALRDRVYQLECDLGMHIEVPLQFRLTSSEARVFGVLLRRDFVTRSMVMTALYSSRIGNEEPDAKIVDVFICKLRKKIEPFGVSVRTVWGQGFCMTAEHKSRVAQLMGKAA